MGRDADAAHFAPCARQGLVSERRFEPSLGEKDHQPLQRSSDKLRIIRLYSESAMAPCLLSDLPLMMALAATGRDLNHFARGIVADRFHVKLPVCVAVGADRTLAKNLRTLQ